MAIESKTSTHVTPAAFVDFEPYCEWQKDEGSETLVVRLPDFKRDQLRVQVNTKGVLKVSGEKPEDGAQRKRFLKETKIPEGCDINDIRAKFSNGFLHITMPKKPQISSLQNQKTEETEKTATKTEDSVSSEAEQNRGICEKDERSTIVKLFEEKKKVVVGVGIAVVAIVAIGAFVACKYGGGSDSGASSSSQIVEEARHH